MHKLSNFLTKLIKHIMANYNYNYGAQIQFEMIINILMEIVLRFAFLNSDSQILSATTCAR